MKPLLAVLLMSFISLHAYARPSRPVVDACLKTSSVAAKAVYTPIPAEAFEVAEDEDTGRIETTLRHGNDVIGVWELRSPKAFGLYFNGSETPLDRVGRLNKRHVPVAFNPYTATWGEIREGAKRYICITFNFDGLGQSGSFQNVRAIYLMAPKLRAGGTFYTVGYIGDSEN